MIAKEVIMIRPAAFGFNAETSVSNSFQQNLSMENIQQKAADEFDAFVSLLRENGITVHVFQDSAEVIKPDAVFPNNWFSTFPDKSFVLYPMCTANRRAERRKDIEDFLIGNGFTKKLNEFHEEENSDLFLEGTGSLVFDHQNKICYAALSPRTHGTLVACLCKEIGYKALLFNSQDKNGKPIYHTNVIMCMGEHFCVICMDCITEKDAVRDELQKSGKEIIEISVNEMEHFAGNMLLLQNSTNEHILVMSDTAFRILSAEKLRKLSKYARILHTQIPTIESIGGGSARCMLAEVF